MTKKRPNWPHKTPLTFVKWAMERHIISVKLETRTINVDTQETILVFCGVNGKQRRLLNAREIFQIGELSITPVGPSLLEINATMRANALGIVAWEKDNEKDLQEYKRLKKKFG